ncbi:hypothetical protein [Thermaerobacter marianensis]|uniref:hypothetical protein n=1 Tax=Thermaerobacter marianensis TaxID=73919 RepID=UPI0005A88173|nr:hypothetical protein [Thermaerobacter marianensis]
MPTVEDVFRALKPWRARLLGQHLLTCGLVGLALAACLALPPLLADRWLVDPGGRGTALVLAAAAVVLAAVQGWRSAPNWADAARAADAAAGLKEQAVTALQPEPGARRAFVTLQRRRALEALAAADPRAWPLAPRRWRPWAAVLLAALLVDVTLWLAPHPLAPVRAQRARWRAELALIQDQVRQMQQVVHSVRTGAPEEPRPGSSRVDDPQAGAGPPRPGAREPTPRPGTEPSREPAQPGSSGAGRSPATGAGPDSGTPATATARDAAGAPAGGGAPAGAGPRGGDSTPAPVADAVAALDQALANLARRLEEAQADPTAATLARVAEAAQRVQDAARAGAGTSQTVVSPELAAHLARLAAQLEQLAREASSSELARRAGAGVGGSPGSVPGGGSRSGRGDGGAPGAASEGSSPGGASGAGAGALAGAGWGTGAGTGAGTGSGGGGRGSGGRGSGAGGLGTGSGGSSWGTGTAGSALAGGLDARLAGGQPQWLPGARTPGSLTLPGWGSESIAVRPGQVSPARQLQGQWAAQAALDLGSGDLGTLPPQLRWLVQAYFGGQGAPPASANP